MSRSRSFNRFHRYLARQKRRGLRAVLPQFQNHHDNQPGPVAGSAELLHQLSQREMELDLLDAEA